MERSAVVLMKANMTKAGLVPIKSKSLKAMRLCRPEFSTAKAIISPPMKRKLVALV